MSLAALSATSVGATSVGATSVTDWGEAQPTTLQFQADAARDDGYTFDHPEQ